MMKPFYGNYRITLKELGREDLMGFPPRLNRTRSVRKKRDDLKPADVHQPPVREFELRYDREREEAHGHERVGNAAS